MTVDRRRVLTALMIAQVMAGLAHGVTYSMGALLAADMAGAAWGGAASTVTTVGAGLWALPLARIVRRRGRRASLSTGLALGSLGALSALGGANTGLFPLVLLGFLFLGAAVAMNLQARFAAADVAAEDTRGRDISLVVWATTVGAVAGPLLFDTTERLGEHLGLASFSGAYLVCILAQWVAVAVLQLMLRPELRPAGAGEGLSDSGPARLRGHPVVGSAIFAVALAHFTMIAIMSMTAVHLHGHGASMLVVGLTVSAHVGGMYALAPLWGVLADKVGTRFTILLGCALTLACAVLLVPFSGDQAVVIVALLLLGLGWSATLVGSSAMLTAAAPEGLRTAFQGRSDLTMNITGALGGVVAGPVVSTFGMPWMAGLVIVLVAVQVGGVTAVWRRAGSARMVWADTQ